MRKIIWYIYVVPPIDFHWEFLHEVDNVSKLLKEGGEALEWSSLNHEEFNDNWAQAQEAAKEYGWEGDFRDPPRVLWFPVDIEFAYGFCFKQGNNGTTFVISPIRLLHMEKLMHE